MDDIQNFSALGARPRRNVRRPLRYEAYETDFPGLGAGYQEESETGGDTRSLHHPPSDTPDDRPHSHVTPLRAELADMQRERFLFQQSHDQMRAGLADFQAIHASLLQLLDRAESLQLSPPPRAPAVHLQSPPAEEEEDWPPPPPPVVFKEGPVSSQSPVTDRIDTMMKELQALKRESMTAQEGQIIPPPESRPRFTSPQPRPTHPPAPPPRAHPPPLKPLPAPTPSPPTPFSASQMHRPSGLAAAPDMTYRGPRPSIPKLTRRDPGEFARLKMALENLLPPESSELFRYQVLLDHLHLEEAKLIADAYLHSATPFSDTMNALNDRLGQPHQLALRRIAAVMDSPDIRRGDAAAFERFSLHIQSLVGMLKTLGPDGEVELQCGSHVARLLSKLPPEQRADFRRCMYNHSGKAYTLDDLATWLKYESWCQDYDSLPTPTITREKPDVRPSRRPVAVLHGAETSPRSLGTTPNQARPQPYCAFCDNRAHHLSQCPEVVKLSREQLTNWIKTNKRCWRCARSHQAAQCTLKKPCSLCQGRHLQVLHDVNSKPLKTPGPASVPPREGENPTGVLYLDRPIESGQVLLKVVPVVLHHNGKTLSTHAVLDDGSERTMLLPAAAQKLDLQGTPETLPLRTIRQDVQTLHGSCVSFEISPGGKPKQQYKVHNAFTATRIDLAEHSYPVESLQRKYRHLRGLPLQSFKKVKPLLLIGSDHPQLITPTEAVRLGPPGGPAAMRTRLGWTLQGPSSLIGSSSLPQQCLFTTAIPPQVSELLKHVEKLWQVDVVPVPEGKVVTRSREDNYAVSLLEQRTVRVEVEGIQRYATPLLRRQNMPHLKASPDAVIPSLRSVERRLQKDPGRAKIYRAEIEKLVQAGSVVKVSPSEVAQADESWYTPHHLVSHNGKDRLVFNCSFQFLGQALNEHLLPGPTLSASLLGVLLRFREHAVAVSGDIKGMFHQIRLLPEDRPLLRFVWRDLHPEAPVAVYEWQVLPFGTTCSPCCATFALQRHTRDHTEGDDPLRHSVGRCFYVDNLLQSVPTPEEARDLVDRLRALLSSAGFVLRQWASNEPSTIGHLPEDLRSTSAELWLTQDKSDTSEPTLGLSWHFPTDTLGYKHRKVSYGAPTMRNIYKVLASQYDPLGFILPYTTRAKMLVRRLWDQQRGWDDPQLPPELLQQWETWEEELPFLAQILLPRPYLPKHITESVSEREIHIFCDASEQAYGAVAYMRTVTGDGRSHLAFLMARSRVAPKRILSIPRLELCGALSGAHLSRLLRNELTLDIKRIVLWSDSTTVLTWLRSESCHFKVFVGTRVAEIQEVTQSHTWRYVDSAQNPADDITRGKTLSELARSNRWSQGPPFLLLSPEQWPPEPSGTLAEPPGPSELRRETFCGVSTTVDPATSNFSGYDTWAQLLEAAITQLHGAAKGGGTSSAQDYIQAEMHVLREAQQESFPEEYRLLKQGKSISRSSRLLALSPEFDREDEVIRVGGRLRRSEDLAFTNSHPLVLDPTHPVTRLLIQDVDSRLRHPGPERVFAEIRRTHWILRGREAVRRFQRTCLECRRWKGRPTVPKMADLPVARLRLYKPAFYSTGVDCFGPFEVKIGRRVEKRWGIIFKCLTIRAVHLDVLTSIDTDAFLMALRRFVARRGTPAELYSDQGTNFRGGERELQAAFAAMTSDLQKLLAPQKIVFHFNPPAAPHFGGVWEREIRSVKTALYTTVGSQPLQEEVLRTVLVEVEGILNSKPLGYVPSDISDPDPVTPNCFLMGRPDGAA
ncbi:uncharacterized protein LOC106097744 [Oreochromis niloticus]|uniref:uncharacterized protein LOC106097744 n=1 Tax=Oreochromis niloticus TaxID=8128 RepID=UPI000905721F|nr:uncharacterized protein LOC106097744 [Oreochromis niloticus]CAI5660547.1 unnamed protein product [Mustela putorius furo]